MWNWINKRLERRKVERDIEELADRVEKKLDAEHPLNLSEHEKNRLIEEAFKKTDSEILQDQRMLFRSIYLSCNSLRIFFSQLFLF